MTAAPYLRRLHEAQVVAGEIACPACATLLAAPHDDQCPAWGLPTTFSPSVLIALCSCRGDDGHGPMDFTTAEVS